MVRLLLTVFGERWSVSAISPVRRPSARSSRISRSRGVSSGNGSVGGGRRRVARSARATATAMPGPKIAWPRDHGPDGVGDLLLLGPLEEVAPGAGLHRGEDGGVVVVHREHEHGGRRAPTRAAGGSPRPRRCRASGRPSAPRRAGRAAASRTAASPSAASPTTSKSGGCPAARPARAGPPGGRRRAARGSSPAHHRRIRARMRPGRGSRVGRGWSGTQRGGHALRRGSRRGPTVDRVQTPC